MTEKKLSYTAEEVEALLNEVNGYKSGDIFAGSSTSKPYVTSAFVSGGQISIMFNVEVSKSIENINTVTVNKLVMNIRTTSGTYLHSYKQGGSDYLLLASSVTAQKLWGNRVCLGLEFSSKLSVTNNTPLSIQLHEIELQFE